MKYMTIKIPNVAFYFIVGLCGFGGFASFFGIITNNILIGWIAGIIGFVIMILNLRILENKLKSIYKDSELKCKNI